MFGLDKIIGFVERYRSRIMRRLIVIAVSAACLFLLFILVNPTICRIAIVKFQEQTGLTVSADNIYMTYDGSVDMVNVKISTLDDPDFKKEILKAERLNIHFEIFSFFSLKARIRNVTVRDFLINIQQDCDAGQWNLSSVRFPVSKTSSPQFPNVRLRRGTFLYLKTINNNPQTVFALMFDANFLRQKGLPNAYDFTMSTSGDGKNYSETIKGRFGKDRLEFSGDMTTLKYKTCKNVFEANDIDGLLTYGTDNSFKFSANIGSGSFTDSSDLKSFIFPKNLNTFKSPALNAINRILFRYNFSGFGSLKIEANGDLDDPCQLKYRGFLDFYNSSVSYYKFIYPLYGISGRIGFTNERNTFENIKGSHDGVDVDINGWAKGFGRTWQSSINIASPNMKLDKDLYFALTSRQKKFWDSFSPAGLVAFDLNITAAIDSDDEINLDTSLKDVSIKYDKFPYQVKNLSGNVIFTRDTVTLNNVISNVSPAKILINGNASAIDPNNPNYSIKIDTENLPFDANFAYALKNSQFPFFAKMNPDDSNFAGGLSMSSHFWNEGENTKFLYDVSADVNDLLLSKAIISLMPDTSGKFLTGFDISGNVDLDLDMTNNIEVMEPKYEIGINCLNNQVYIPKLGYSFKDVTGLAKITNNALSLQNLSGSIKEDINFVTPNSAKPIFTLNGDINLHKGIFSDANFSASGSNLPFDSRICGFFENGNLSKACQSLSPGGVFDLDLRKLSVKAADNNSKDVDIDAGAEILSASVQTTPPLTDLKGLFNISCRFNTADKHPETAVVDMSADLIKIKDIEIKNAVAKINYEPNSSVFRAEKFVGDLYKGKLSVNQLELKNTRENDYQYNFNLSFIDVNLNEYHSDKASGSKSSANKGMLSGYLSIGGVIGDHSNRIGSSHLEISQMQVAEVSPIAKLIQIIPSVKPEDYFFDKMIIDFNMKANKLIIDQFDMSGQNISFNGNGYIDLDKQKIDMKLTARGRNVDSSKKSFLQPVADVFSRTFIRMDISGNPNDPKVEVVTLPVIKDTINLFGTRPEESERKK